MKRLICAAIVLMLIPGCGEDDRHTSSPEPAEPSIELAFIDSIGVETGDSTYMFGSIEGLSYAPDGSIFLLDRAFCRIMVYSPAGEFQRQIGYSGEGPGGMNLPVLMILTGDGDIIVSQLDAMEQYDFLTGEWICEYPREGGMPLPFVLHGMPDSTFAAVHMDLIEEDSRIVIEIVLGIYAPGCSEPLTGLSTSSFDYDPTNASFMFDELFDGYSVAVADDGSIYAASRSGSEYRVTEYNISGEVLSEIIREDIEPLEKSAEIIEEEREYMEARLASIDAAGLSCSPHPLYPMISDIGIDQDGNLWVRRGQSHLPVFDIYDETGNLLGTAALQVDPGEGRYWNISVQPGGILAYSENPSQGFQKVYMIEVR